MPGRWERFSDAQNLTTAGSHTNLELFSNQPDPAAGGDVLFERDVVIVDGIVTIHTDTDDLCGVRLVVAHEIIASGDISDTVPAEHDDMLYYSWFVARGPMIFRLRSKKTIHPNEKLWLTSWKENGSTATTIRTGMRLFVVPKSG